MRDLVNLIATLIDGRSVALVSPSAARSSAVWRYFERTLQGGGTLNYRERIVGFPYGGTLYLFHAENSQAMRGRSFDLCIVDDHVPANVVDEMVTPSLIDSRGQMLVWRTA